MSAAETRFSIHNVSDEVTVVPEASLYNQVDAKVADLYRDGEGGWADISARDRARNGVQLAYPNFVGSSALHGVQG